MKMPPKTTKSKIQPLESLTTQLSIDHSVHFYKKIEQYITSKQPELLLDYIDELEQQNTLIANGGKLQSKMLQRRISCFIAETISIFALCNDEIGINKLIEHTSEIYEIIGVIATFTPQKLLFVCELPTFQSHIKDNLEAWKQEANSQNWKELLQICEKVEGEMRKEDEKQLKTQMKKLKLNKAQLRELLEQMSDSE